MNDTELMTSLSSEYVIEVKGLVKRYGDFTAVNGIDFQVRQDEVFGLLGCQPYHCLERLCAAWLLDGCCLYYCNLYV